MELDNIVTKAWYENSMLVEDWEWTPPEGPTTTVRATPDEGYMTTVKEEGREDVSNTDIELKVRRSEVDSVKVGDIFAHDCIAYKVRSANVLNTTEMVIKLTRVL